MDHNWSQESVRDMRCILLNLSAGDAQNSVVGEGGENTRRRSVRRIVDRGSHPQRSTVSSTSHFTRPSDVNYDATSHVVDVIQSLQLRYNLLATVAVNNTVTSSTPTLEYRGHLLL